MRALWTAVMLWLIPIAALAGAWPQAPGVTQVIVSYEPGSATRGFDDAGHTVVLNSWKQNDASVFFDYGATKRLSLTLKVNLKDYRTDFDRFSGLGSIEAGGRIALHADQDYVLAVGASVEGLGKGRRNDFDTGTKTGTDSDLRVYFGKPLRLFGRDAYVDLQAARHLRQYDESQWRVDATVGIKPSKRWLVIAQTFGGQTDRASWGRAQWLNGQLSAVRYFDDRGKLGVQFGVRQTLSGRNVPKVATVVVALWHRF